MGLVYVFITDFYTNTQLLIENSDESADFSIVAQYI